VESLLCLSGFTSTATVKITNLASYKEAVEEKDNAYQNIFSSSMKKETTSTKHCISPIIFIFARLKKQ